MSRVWDSECDLPRDECFPPGEYAVVTKTEGGETHSYNKQVHTYLEMPGYKIPLRVRERVFSLTVHDRTDTSGSLYMDDHGNLHHCGDVTSTPIITVSEDAKFIDSTVYIVDTDSENAYWREDLYTVKFADSSSDLTGFHHAFFTGHKIRFNNVDMIKTVSWKLMVNGIVETVYTETGTLPIARSTYPLFIVWGQPIAGGETTDPDFMEIGTVTNGVPGKGFRFTPDFRGSGGGPTEEEIACGGIGFYYPEWLRGMGTYREEDQAEAYQRFVDTYGSETNLKVVTKRNVNRPSLKGWEPLGSIIRDFEGNTFVSISARKGNGNLLHVNRLVDNSGVVQVIPETLDGDEIRYYPVGLI